MKFRFQNLALVCKQQSEKIIVEFSPQLSLFYGKMSSGKSTIARLIDHCLGGDLERTPALVSELVSVELTATIGKYDVIFERKAFGSNQIQVTWTNETKEYATVLAPLTAGDVPIWGNNVYNFSDLIFYLSGMDPLKIPKNAEDEDTVRLSFRDIMWYCYLEQNHLDSSFYWLTFPFKEKKSRYVLNFVVGSYNEKLNKLYNQLANLKEMKLQKEVEIRNLITFLKQFGYNSENEILDEMFDEEIKKKNSLIELKKSKEEFSKEPHLVDSLRGKIKEQIELISKEEAALNNSNERLREQRSLRAELIATKFKLVRSKSAKNILEGVAFDFCPCCGARVFPTNSSDKCQLCKQDPSEVANVQLPTEDAVKIDLDSRIFELEDSMKRIIDAQLQTQQLLEKLRSEKESMDQQLMVATNEYDSKYLARTREFERQVTSSNERIQNLQKIVRLPQAVGKMERELQAFNVTEQQLKTEIQHDEANLTTSDELISEIETTYLDTLKTIKLPGINEDDRIEINRKTWIPYILPHGFSAGKWDFFNAGSGGKKTLLNVCYALAIHKVAAEHNLPLPEFLIIDSPMKNIGKLVNKEIFEAFYHYLYDLAEGPLSQTQFIIIETDFVAPPETIDQKVRQMSPDDPEHPPLIPYYHGP